ncbi:MAG: gliding motility-associated C-terminal domain-containing protein [Saprospirales bacterium]|nr:gliding motility-associated C-terminal domain-containing protein [Saprospirales bacterium]
MHKLLIPLLICFTATQVHAQVPKIITLNPSTTKTQPNPITPDAACSAGTFTVGQFIGQSNDIDLDTIYLCLGDSIFIDHNGDQMFMDPDPLTAPGIAYAFYKCPPTQTGDEMLVLADPCLWPGAAGNGFWATGGPLSGDHWFFNSGSLINSTTFGMGNPVLIHFAPITITDYANGQLEPGCVDVNINADFAVVYLKSIAESGIVTNFGDDCKGKFRLRGGYPEWDLNSTYTVSITLASDPSVKALIYTPPAQMKHSTDIIFSVPQPGVYNVTVEDGKSCDHTFQINMNACNSNDNVVIALPELVSPPGSSICIPVTVNNFTNIIGASYSLTWDPTVLNYTGIQNANPAIQPFTAANNLNTNNTAQGFLGVVFSDFVNPNGTTIPANGVFFDICFNVVAPLGACTPLGVSSFPSLVTMDNAFGPQLAITVDTGQLCVDFNPLNVSFFVNTPNCNGTASVGAIITGGIAPYDVTWQMVSGGATTLVTSNVADTILTNPLPEGDWRVCVTDQNGVGTTVCDTLTIDVPSLGATLAVVQSPLCNGGTDGALRADVTIDGVIVPNPGAAFTYLWSTAPPQSTQTIAGIPAGNYTVTVTNTATGCTSIAAGSLSQPAPITVDIAVTPASCPGIADGQIITTAMGGTPGAVGNEYIFSWEYSPNASLMPLFIDDAGAGNPFTISGKLAGYYLLTVRDGNSCTYVHPVEIELPNLREVTVDLKDLFDPSCAGLANGSIAIEVNAQPAFVAPDYLFFWNPVPPTAPGPYPQANMGNMSTLSSLPFGTYEILALETISGCSDTATFVLTEPQPLDLAIVTKTNPSCLLQNNGAIAVSGSGGTGGPNYNYTWSSAPVVPLSPTPNQQNLTPGTYTVTITDANGCSDSLTIPLPLPVPPAITAIDSTAIVCGADGCLSVTAPTAVSFQWSTLSGNAIGNTAQVCNLPGDTYVVTIRDAQSCVNSDTVSLAPVVPLFFADTLLSRPVCNGGADGSIALDIQGGNPGYTYTWGGGQITPVIFAIPAGAYSVTVTDLKGCKLFGTFVLPNPPGIVLQYNGITPATCPGVCDGGATVVTYYNTVPPTLANFDFMWEDGSTDSIRVDLCPGYNAVTVTDPSNNCFRIDSISIDSPPDFAASFDTIPATCFGGDDGEARVMVSGGNGLPYTYIWSNGATINTATGLSAGPVTLTVTDNGGCTAVLTTEITEPGEIIVTQDLVNSTNILCFGDSSGILAVDATGGNPGGFTYKWENISGTIGTANPVENLASGAYSVTVTDTKGCTGVLLNLVMSDPPAVQGLYDPWEEILCHGDETTLFIDTIFGGSGAPYRFSLDFGVYLDPGFPVPLSGGEHYITYLDRLGCEYTDTIFVPEPDPITVVFDPNIVEIELGDSVQLQPIITGAVVDDFTWTPAELLSNPDTLEPFTRTYESQNYTLVVSDMNGCSATGSIQINIDPNRNVYIPNVFIPGNPRGLNDHFNPNVGRGVETVSYMRIFDRWGNLMYEREMFYPNNNDFAEGWDGKYKGQYVNPGVYVYAIEVKFLDRRVLLYRGDVTVIR